jgi:hypothetical protein
MCWHCESTHHFQKDCPHKSDEDDWRWIRDSWHSKKERKLLKRDDGHSQNAAAAAAHIYWVRAPMGSHQGPSTTGHNNASACNVEASATLPRKTLSLETNRKEGDCFTTHASKLCNHYVRKVWSLVYMPRDDRQQRNKHNTICLVTQYHVSCTVSYVLSLCLFCVL